jgi:dimethylhistidine N-methyltransferase
VELGSGSAEKTEPILEEFHQKNNSFNFVPIDVSDIIIESSAELLNKYDKLSITGIISEYEKGLSFVSRFKNNKKLILFLGSSIGNLNPSEIDVFLKMLRTKTNPDDFILIGFDLVKDRDILFAAYNDTSGITREFNLNILRRINRELDGEFDLNKFEHRAFFNEDHLRMEMHLVAKEAQKVNIGALQTQIEFEEKESIHTENSHKFTIEMINSYAHCAGLKLLKTWRDSQDYYALCLFKRNY